MKTATVTVLLAVVALSVFTLLNWTAIARPATVSLGFTTVHAPVGLILLLGAGLLTATFLVYVVFQQASALVEARRFARELRSERELADRAEASRLTELRAFLQGELGALSNGAAASRADLEARLDRLGELLMARLAEVGNGLAAHVAEVEDKLDRAGRPDAN